MDNDKKNVLMQYLYRIAEHYKIEGAASTTFKKRADLLDKLKQANKEAWVIVDELFNSFLICDRIANDKEKYDKARLLWDAEHAAAEKVKVSAEMQLIEFCRTHGIRVGSLEKVI